MKRRFTLIIIASLLMFSGASPWEGAAAVAPSGEMPPVGLFIATNAFPRNTVVDITNIETGKSTRAIVSNSLTSPGLLAVVSREAADLIGMRAGSVSRIRMVQPADPMAYMRFTESMTASNPGYAPGLIDEENLIADVYGDDTYTPPDAVNEISEAPRRPPSVPGYIIDEPEWGGRGRLQIIDVPDYNVEPVEQFTEPPPAAQTPTASPPAAQTPTTNPPAAQTLPSTEYIAEPEPVKQSVYVSEQGKESKQDIKEPLNYIKEPSRDIVKDVSPKIEKETPESLSELPRNEVVKAVPDFKTETPRNEVVKEVSPWQERVEVAAAPVQQQAQQPETPIQAQPQQQPQSPPEQQHLVPVETGPKPPPVNDSSNVHGIRLEDIIPGSGVEVKTPERPNITENNRTPTNPNLPNTIDRLERGKYYVQVTALPADLVENTLRQIDRGFNPKVFKGTNNMYHILIGPLNQGESAAVLARFKSIGYKDAIVRIGG